jgi:hypothetical protein
MAFGEVGGGWLLSSSRRMGLQFADIFLLFFAMAKTVRYQSETFAPLQIACRNGLPRVSAASE